MTARQRADAAAGQEAYDPHGRRRSSDWGQPMRRRLRDQGAPADPRADVGGPGRRVDLHAVESPRGYEQTGLDGGGRAMARALNRDLPPAGARETHRSDHVVLRGSADHDRRPMHHRRIEAGHLVEIPGFSGL